MPMAEVFLAGKLETKGCEGLRGVCTLYLSEEQQVGFWGTLELVCDLAAFLPAV